MRSLRRRLSASGLVLTLLAGMTIAARPGNEASAPSQVRITSAFDTDWRFFKGDPPGGETEAFDDAAWRKMDVPHDWSIEGPFDANNPTGGAGGFLPAGTGWYRKHFVLPAAYKGRRVFIDFDGVMANSDVFVNGFHLGKRPYGFVSFRYELTDHLRFGEGENVLAVRADNSGQPASRWYTGAGIYRHVRLVVTDPVYLEHWATFVTTPKVAADRATVRVETTVVNQSEKARDVSVEVTLLGPVGQVVGSADQVAQTGETRRQTIAAGKTLSFTQDLIVRSPHLWNLDHPELYRALITVREGKTALDDELATFGIRDARFDAETGFWLNGRNLKMKGVCLHHDGGGVGAAVPLRVWERRLAALKELGVNAIRTSHNPPAPEFLDLCDRMGFLVMDELFDCWTVAKNPYDYHLYFNEWSKIDAADTVRRDRNHPSVVVYSVGNEIHDTPNGELAKRILKDLIPVFHAEDPTRPVTQALFRPNVSHDYDNGLADLLDVVGQNYRENEILAAHQQKPSRKILGTENRHDRTVWLALRDNKPYAGQFLWTGIDYLGEAARWPLVSHSSGLLDLTGTPRPLAFERQSWWSEKPMVYMTRRIAPTALSPTDPGYEPDLQRRQEVLFSDWTPKNLSPHQENVEVYSNAEQVELFLNGRSLGSKALPADASPRTWEVPFEAGTIRAVAKNSGRIVAAHELRTAGEPAKIVLTVDRNRIWPVWDDVAYVMAEVLDANGVLVPSASDLIGFKISGPGVIAAVESGDNASHESFQTSERRAYQGRCFALVKAKANSALITIAASAPGLAGSSITIQPGRL